MSLFGGIFFQFEIDSHVLVNTYSLLAIIRDRLLGKLAF